MQNAECRILLGLFLTFCSLLLPLNAQEPNEEIKSNIPVVGRVSYNIQKYTGFNLFFDFLSETVIKTIVKLKTDAKDVNCNLQIFSGWDLLKKKAKSFHLDVKDLYIKNVPVEYVEVRINDPIYFKKNQKKKNKIVYPISINSKIIVNPNSVIEMLDNMAKSKTGVHEVILPLPPFGSTKVLLRDLMVYVNNNGFVQSTLNVVSVVNPESEPLKAMFSGDVVISDKKLIVSDLHCEIEDIFTKDSDVSMSFCDAVSDLINPVINFHKYEKRGLTIDNVDLSFPENKFTLTINLMLSSEPINEKK